MLLRITVLQYKGAPPPAALAYMFDENGGSIGRESCNLTLPDDTRVLSRVQAQIIFADGEFSLVDQGGNPSVVNSLRVGKGLSRVLYDGDIIELCDYKLRVKAIGTAAKNGGDTLPMRAVDPMPSQDLVPPILLDPDELTGASLGEILAAAKIAPADAEPDTSFDMDVDFDNLDDPEEQTATPHDPAATAGLYEPLHTPQPEVDTAEAATPAILLDARELTPEKPTENYAALLSALCLGMGIPAPETTGAMRPHHMGIIMRRAMQRALASVLAGLTPQDIEKRLTDHALPEMTSALERKSKLWELFEQGHADISREAEDLFHARFGEELLNACKAQVRNLQQHN
ncbi:type VI secretion system-associated FHA domain protein [Uliginosibacterium sp. H3]|uniref:Type VI secretion system-associated FHA domain protein n=1 Tax=Uliginosibacterium silvisoli TaxID=3114758 RepID=A0ABU6K4J6_9RHOO|nr:type VI secretion system-associated FHA domain protein [Uliginosibacterium sp. H3]